MTPPSITPLSSLQFPPGFQEIGSIITGYKRHQVLDSALKIGIFDHLQRTGGSTRDELVSSLPLCGMLSSSYLAVLISLDLLTQNGDRYQNTRIARDFLVSSSPYYQGDLITGSSQPGSRWDRLAEAMQSSTGTLPADGPGPSPQFLHALAQRTIHGEAQSLIRWIASLPDFSARRLMLDIGGGHGLMSIGLCQMNPHLHAVILDQPHICELTSAYIRRYGMEGQVTFKAGDIRTEQYDEPYDIILISHLLYKFRNDLDSIFRNLCKGLKNGGILVSNHWFCSPGCTPGQDPVQELERSLQSAGHPLCHPEMFERLFDQYGLICIKTGSIETEFGPTTVHAAKRVSP